MTAGEERPYFARFGKCSSGLSLFREPLSNTALPKSILIHRERWMTPSKPSILAPGLRDNFFRGCVADFLKDKIKEGSALSTVSSRSVESTRLEMLTSTWAAWAPHVLALWGI
jgi:hypothetical protein